MMVVSTSDHAIQNRMFGYEDEIIHMEGCCVCHFESSLASYLEDIILRSLSAASCAGWMDDSNIALVMRMYIVVADHALFASYCYYIGSW